jgi:hypothetical protein
MTPPSKRRSEPAFFHAVETHELIESLAARESLTIFAGAGISRDRGSPGWEELVVRLLQRPLLHLTDGPEDPRSALRAAQAYADSYGPVPAASALRQLYQDRNPRLPEKSLMELIAGDIHECLYPRNSWSPGGPLAEAVVRLAVFWMSLGRDVAILTTNYDNNLEEFAGDEDLRQFAADRGITIEAKVADDPRDAQVIPVYHLHGYIPFEGASRGNLAFSESGLFEGTEVIGPSEATLDWRPKVLDDRLTSAATVFVGTTLRDPTVARSLIRTRAAAEEWPRYGVFPQQGDTWDEEDNPGLRLGADHTLRARLKHLEVSAVRPDFFGQVAQLLREVVHCKLNCDGHYAPEDSAPNRYGVRLVKWWEAWRRNLKRVRPRVHQDACQVQLAKTKGTVAKCFSDQRRVSRERLKLEIWVRKNPSKGRRLELWGSSEVASRTTTGHISEIENQSEYAAVRALCQGYAVRGPLEAASRWRSYFSVPIVLSGDPWWELPVGVVNLMSTKDVERSSLALLDAPAVWKEVRDVLKSAGIMILDPDSRAWLDADSASS